MAPAVERSIVSRGTGHETFRGAGDDDNAEDAQAMLAWGRQIS